MFQVGEKIFYPMHGACVVQAIEEKEVLGESQTYYVVNFDTRNMQVMFPRDKVSSLGIRPIVTQDVLDNVLDTFHEGETDTNIRDNLRNRHNLNKLKSGDIYEIAEVIRDLVRLSQTKKLGTVDKNMLDSACEILTSEVELVKGLSHQKASDLIHQIIQID